MKCFYTTFSAFILILFLCTCSMGGVDVGLVGTWELIDYSGSSNTAMDLEIDKDDTYKWIIVNNGQRTTKYGDMKGDVGNRTVRFEHNDSWTEYSYNILCETLTISSSVYSYTFKRISF